MATSKKTSGTEVGSAINLTDSQTASAKTSTTEVGITSGKLSRSSGTSGTEVGNA